MLARLAWLVNVLLTSTESNCLTHTQQQQNKFAKEPMAQKEVSDIPGIGPKYHRRLKRAGFKYANEVFGQYLKHGERTNHLLL